MDVQGSKENKDNKWKDDFGLDGKYKLILLNADQMCEGMYT